MLILEGEHAKQRRAEPRESDARHYARMRRLGKRAALTVAVFVALAAYAYVVGVSL